MAATSLNSTFPPKIDFNASIFGEAFLSFAFCIDNSNLTFTFLPMILPTAFDKWEIEGRSELYWKAYPIVMRIVLSPLSSIAVAAVMYLDSTLFPIYLSSS